VPTAKQRLRKRLADRQREKAELERTVRGLRARCQAEVEPLQERVLRVQVEQLRRAAQAHMRSARLRNAYHDAQEAYEAFQETRGPAPPGDVQAAYRRASKLCHPDAVPDAYREEAIATFQSLESAYEAGHGAAVEAIAQGLQEWGFPKASSSDTSPLSINHLSEAVADVEAAIQSLRTTDAFRRVQEAGTIDAAVEARKRELARRIRALSKTEPRSGSRRSRR